MNNSHNNNNNNNNYPNFKRSADGNPKWFNQMRNEIMMMASSFISSSTSAGSDDTNEERSASNSNKEEQNGYIHPSLEYCSKTRRLFVSQPVNDKDTLMMRIPYQALITKQRLQTMLPILQKLEKKIKIRQSQQQQKTTTTQNQRRKFYSSSSSPCNDDSEDDDMWIAFGLSMVHVNNTSQNDNHHYDGDCQQQLSQLSYLSTLPELTTTLEHMLPRQWSNDNITNLLKGSSSLFLKRIEDAKLNVQHDYEMLQQTWNDLHKECNNNKEEDDINNTSLVFPSFDVYSSMLAAVSSRAFVRSDDSNVSSCALIPILDLCDHCRGSSHEKKNVSYKFWKDGTVEVKSCQALSTRESLRITYGAQGNHQLLFNYGFCIANNLEPDGSSNDIFEWKLPSEDNEVVVQLRTGPKSYTYGKFVQVLETFMMMATNNKVDDGQKNETKKADGVVNDFDGAHQEDNDMEASLNEEEAEAMPGEDEEDDDNDIYGEMGDNAKNEDEDDDEGMNDMLYGGAETGGDDDDNGIHQNDFSNDQIQFELDALKLYKIALKDRISLYSVKGKELIDKLASASSDSIEHYTSLLLYSEQRTIYFYLRAIEKLQKCLLRNSKTNYESKQQHLEQTTEFVFWNNNKNADDDSKDNDYERIETQTDQLVEAYMKIRHGGILP